MKTIALSLFSNRAKSFFWRTGMMALALIVDEIAVNIGLFDLPILATGILGLVFGEISKAINNSIR